MKINIYMHVHTIISPIAHEVQGRAIVPPVLVPPVHPFKKFAPFNHGLGLK